MSKVVSVEDMRQIEAAADKNGLTYAMMMENAGRATAKRALDMLADLENAKVTLLIGAGNNGGDGLVAGRYIAEQEDVDVRFYLLKRREDDDPNFKAVQEAELFVAYAEDDQDQRVLRNMIASADLIVDALFGVGIRLPIKGDAEKLLRTAKQALNQRRSERPDEAIIHPTRPEKDPHPIMPRVLAVDCPSGLDCDTGELDSNAIPADETVTFVAAKPGLLTFPGASAVGELSIASIGVSDDLLEKQETQWTIATVPVIRTMLPERPIDSHKGTYGKALIVAGSVNYSGAAGLCAMAAYRSGAGLVTVGSPPSVVRSLSAQLSEPTWLVLPHDLGVISEAAASLIVEESDGYQALLLGPGWGQEDTTRDLLNNLLEKPDEVVSRRNRRDIGFISDDQESSDKNEPINLPPLVIDADGLNLLAKMDEWWKLLPENTIITPHPGEMSRLSGLGTGEIQSNRREIATEKAKEWSVILMLKGAHTLVAAPDERLTVLPFKTDALATAGTGDVLAGLVVGMLAQGLEPYDAAVAGGYVHGLAGEIAARHSRNSRSVAAGDVLRAIPEALSAIELS